MTPSPEYTASLDIEGNVFDSGAGVIQNVLPLVMMTLLVESIPLKTQWREN